MPGVPALLATCSSVLCDFRNPGAGSPGRTGRPCEVHIQESQGSYCPSRQVPQPDFQLAITVRSSAFSRERIEPTEHDNRQQFFRQRLDAKPQLPSTKKLPLLHANKKCHTLCALRRIAFIELNCITDAIEWPVRRRIHQSPEKPGLGCAS